MKFGLVPTTLRIFARATAAQGMADCALGGGLVKQITQRLRDGKISVIEIPAPVVTPDGVLVDVRASLLSAGTERAKVQTGKQSLLGKARSRPDQVKQVIEKAQRDGLRDTVRAVRSRLEQPSPLGYSCAGVVLAVGDRVSDVVPGDRVACGGADYAVHADVVHVPGNLCVPLRDELDFDQGAFGTVGSIALHGVRQADSRLGERVGVIGLGLVGQLAGQILRAAGCTVVGIDLSPELVARATRDGAADVAFTRADLGDRDLPAAAAGCDAVVITAAADSTDPVELAARLCRDRGRVVIVGDVPMQLPRATYYGKELDLRLSRSYGPGRYDREYEERGLDYPIGYVRWTERRNIAAFLNLVADGRVSTESLVTARIDVDDAEQAYERLVSEQESPLGIVIRYDPTPEREPSRTVAPAPRKTAGTRVGVIGAGSFAQSTLIPGLSAAGFELTSIASATGRSAHAAQAQFGFDRLDGVEELVDADDLDVIAIASRHATHAELAARALRAGKAVFVEKPPGLTMEELDDLRRARAETGLPLLVGFNRRHAPLAIELRQRIRKPGLPFELLFRVNAGALPADHWLNDPDDGGGRLRGEGCHFIDFACWFAGELPTRVTAAMRAAPGQTLAAAQSFSVALDFGDGSLATVFYSAEGGRELQKEYVEAHSAGQSAALDDFKRDKGHKAQFAHLFEVVTGRTAQEQPDPLDSMAVTLAALRSAETGTAVAIRP
jgi:polar amino acid transport system substrate-binding protein